MGNWNTYFSANVSNNSGFTFANVAARLADTGIFQANEFSELTVLDDTFGYLWSWGSTSTALGHGDTIRRSSPVQVGSLTDWKQVSCSISFSASVKTDGTLWIWGDNQYGRLGLGDTNGVLSPVQVGTLTNWKQVACGDNHTACVKTDGTLWTWGYNLYGQLALGDTIDRSSPVQVGSLTNWSQVSCGRDYTACVKTDGTLWTWGINSQLNGGQLALGDTIDRSSPVQVGTLTNWSQVSCGVTYSACVKTDGTLWTWGRNNQGQLGLGDTIDRSSPVQVGSLTNWSQVNNGRNGSHGACVKTDGTLWTWGSNSSGQLGPGDAIDRSSPIQVGTLTNWKQVACGRDFTACVKTDGTLWTWGRNNQGQLGLGNTIDRSSPVQVGTLTNWKQVTGGFGHFLALTNPVRFAITPTSVTSSSLDETSAPGVAMRQFANNSIQVSGFFDETSSL